jgi:aspartate racemase
MGTGAEPERIGDRKLYLYDTAALLASLQPEAVLLPCFISHTFLGELQREVQVPIVNMMEALARRLQAGQQKLGILCTGYVQDCRLFERYLTPERLCYPSEATRAACITPTIYGPDGVLAGVASSAALARLHTACLELLAQGAELIVPGSSEIAVFAEALCALGLPVLDSHQVYVDHALSSRDQLPRPVFKLGVIGGIGPAATVDFMQKVIRNTSAECDQDHIRLIVDHNPQIPDRTANLVGQGRDPTLALYSACKRLEANGAALIVMPCNTAHAYVPRLQPGLSVPIVNMLHETVRHIRQHCAGHATVGLLATTGTVISRVYHDAARDADFDLIVPDARHQTMVMDAIYGEQGVKAGFVDGPCKDALLQAMSHLAERGATVVILGCTELPLLLPEHRAFDIGGRRVVMLDPTAILARRCVVLAVEAEKRCCEIQVERLQ